jgi:hypothetical protein
MRESLDESNAVSLVYRFARLRRSHGRQRRVDRDFWVWHLVVSLLACG